jgi:superfamily II DNA or RNA helicase
MFESSLKRPLSNLQEFLAQQWRERINQFCPGSTIGLVQGDTINIECDFVIAMLQSLSMREYSFKHFESIGVVFADEAHHVCAKVFSQALFKFCPRHCFALSATPDRKDGLTKVLHWCDVSEHLMFTVGRAPSGALLID